MNGFIDERLIKLASVSAFVSGVLGSLLMVIYLAWHKSDASGADMLTLVFMYMLITPASIIGAWVGSLAVGVPLAVIAERAYPDASFKGSVFMVGAALFIWLAALAWPVMEIFDIPYADILLLTPYVFCSAAAMAYWMYRDTRTWLPFGLGPKRR
ncbi:hypothetical protein [Pseudomonas phoenicis]|uniref:hypothetical protein n=1 Tax=unclassified Pseudomonas TaxID=196821 RepID=UPI0039A3AA41